MEKVELHPAFVWDCPECGREQFERAVVAELSAEDVQNIREEYGMDPWESGFFLAAPNGVECSDCHAQFETEEMK